MWKEALQQGQTPPRGRRLGIASAVAERRGASGFPTAGGADKTSDSRDKYFGCSTVTFLPPHSGEDRERELQHHAGFL